MPIERPLCIRSIVLFLHSTTIGSFYAIGACESMGMARVNEVAPLATNKEGRAQGRAYQDMTRGSDRVYASTMSIVCVRVVYDISHDASNHSHISRTIPNCTVSADLSFNGGSFELTCAF